MQNIMDTPSAEFTYADSSAVTLVNLAGESYVSIGTVLKHWLHHELVILPCYVYVIKVSLNYSVFINQVDDVLFSLFKASLYDYCKVAHWSTDGDWLVLRLEEYGIEDLCRV